MDLDDESREYPQGRTARQDSHRDDEADEHPAGPLAGVLSPGVAAPCRDIDENPEQAFNYTAKGNLVGVVSDGSAVPGKQVTSVPRRRSR